MKSPWNHFAELRALYLMRESLSYVEFAYCLALLVNNDAKNGGTSHISPETIAKQTGFSVRHIETAAAAMKRRGIVSVVEPGKRGRQSLLRLSATTVNAPKLTSVNPDESTEAHFGDNAPKPTSENEPDSPKPTARLTEVETCYSPKPTSDSTEYLTTSLTSHGCAVRDGQRGKPHKQPTGGHAEVVRAYCDAWQSLYHVPYSFADAKDGALVKRLIDTAGSAGKAKQIIAAYFGDDDPWLHKNAHPLSTLISRVNTYLARLAGGIAGDGDLVPTVYPTAEELAAVIADGAEVNK